MLTHSRPGDSGVNGVTHTWDNMPWKCRTASSPVDLQTRYFLSRDDEQSTKKSFSMSTKLTKRDNCMSRCSGVLCANVCALRTLSVGNSKSECVFTESNLTFAVGQDLAQTFPVGDL